MAVAYDNPIPGYNTTTCTNLRLWEAEPVKVFDLAAFNAGDYEKVGPGPRTAGPGGCRRNAGPRGRGPADAMRDRGAWGRRTQCGAAGPGSLLT